MTDRESQIRLGYSIDQASVGQAKQFIDEVTQRYERLTSATAKIGPVANQSGRELINGIRQSRQELEAAGSAADGLGDKLQKAGKVDIGLSGLRRTGSALTQLGLGEIGRPVQLAGDVGQVGKEITEVTSAIGALGISTGTLLTVAGPVALAVGALALAVGGFFKIIEDGRQEIAKAVDEQQKYFEFVATHTTAEARQRIEAEQKVQAAYDKTAENIKGLIANEINRISPGTKPELIADTFNKNSDYRSTLLTTVEGALGPLKALFESLDKLQDGSAKSGSAIDQLTNGIKQGDFAATDLAAAEKLLADARNKNDIAQAIEDEKGLAAARQAQIQAADKLVHKLDENRGFELQLEDLKRNGREKDLDAELRKRDDELRANNREIHSLEGLKDVTGKYSDKIKELKDRNQQLIQQQEILIGQAQFYTDANEKRALGEERDKRVADVRDKYNQQTEAAEQRSADKKLQIQQKYVDAGIAATEKLRDATTAALRQLEQQKEDLRTGLSRDLSKTDREALDKELDIQIKSHRTEQQALTEHVRRLQEIRNGDAAEIEGALLDRNFLSVLQIRLREGADVQKEDTTFGNRQADLQTSQKNDVEDLRRSIEIQRRERNISYQQQLDDARLSYRRSIQLADEAKRVELQRAADAKQRDLTLLNNAVTQETNIRRGSYEQQLKLAILYGAAFVAAEEKRQKDLLAQVRADARTSAQPAAGQVRIVRRAQGGPVEPGQLYLVNDRDAAQRESVNGVALPGGIGYYMPLQRGMVSGGGAGGGTYQLTQHIHDAHNPYVTAQIAREQVVTFFEKMTGSGGQG